MHFAIKKLYNMLNLYQQIVVYGTGNYAKQIYPYLVESGLREKIICFTQTTESKIDSIDGVEVINIDALDCDKEKCVVLIAVSGVYTNEIGQTLSEHQYTNVVSLVDYIWDYDKKEELFSGLTTYREYCEFIADWYVETHVEKVEKEEIINKLIRRGESVKKETDHNLIVMICGHISSRTYRIAGALRKKQYDIVMLDHCRNTNPWCLQELQKIDMKIYRCRCIEEMLYYALQYCPLAYFFEPRWGDYVWAEIMLKNKNYFGNIAIASYDVLNEGYLGRGEKWLEAEKYAFEHADGIVWRWFSKQALEKRGFQFKGKSIQFLDYCCSRDRKEKIISADTNVVKLCAAAGYGDEYIEKKTYTTQYIDFARIDEILEKIGNRKDCVFHFYAGGLNQDNMEICRQYEEVYRNFKVFIGIEHQELLKRLEEYDYGSYLCTDGEFPDENVPIGAYYGNTFKNGIRNAYFDFLDAGLAIITTHAPKLWEYLSDYDVVIRMNLSNIDIDYLYRNRKYYKDQAEIARKALVIDKHIQKLIDFFGELSM